MELLEPEPQHRSVDLVQDVASYFNHEVWTNAYDIAVECCMVELAQSEAVRRHRLTLGMRVRKDVGCIKKFGMPEPTHRAGLSVRTKDSVPERQLMQPLTGQARHVGTSSLVRLLPERFDIDSQWVINGNCEGKGSWVIFNDEDWPLGQVQAFGDPVKVDKREPLNHRSP